MKQPAAEAVKDNEAKESKKENKQESKKDEQNSDEEKHAALLAYAANWPEKAVQGLEQALKDGRPYKIVFAGSESLGTGDNSWPMLVQKALLIHTDNPSLLLRFILIRSALINT